MVAMSTLKGPGEDDGKVEKGEGDEGEAETGKERWKTGELVMQTSF